MACVFSFCVQVTYTEADGQEPKTVTIKEGEPVNIEVVRASHTHRPLSLLRLVICLDFPLSLCGVLCGVGRCGAPR